MRSVVAVTATLLACAPPRGGLVLPGVLAKQKPPTTSFYAGLRNQGNTCYLNSLVQTLYHVRPFRETVLRTCVSLDAPPPKRRLLSRLNPLSGRRKSQRPPGSTAEALAAIFARCASRVRLPAVTPRIIDSYHRVPMMGSSKSTGSRRTRRARRGG
mmetsp:Transcript_23773/g.94262  ORF Transcript_23773/g.94262 Transcript_23773/m.94262 type:complete len:156 (-) Transcript_23773:570-1037(-)